MRGAYFEVHVGDEVAVKARYMADVRRAKVLALDDPSIARKGVALGVRVLLLDGDGGERVLERRELLAQWERWQERAKADAEIRKALLEKGAAVRLAREVRITAVRIGIEGLLGRPLSSDEFETSMVEIGDVAVSLEVLEKLLEAAKGGR